MPSRGDRSKRGTRPRKARKSEEALAAAQVLVQVEESRDRSAIVDGRMEALDETRAAVLTIIEIVLPRPRDIELVVEMRLGWVGGALVGGIIRRDRFVAGSEIPRLRIRCDPRMRVQVTCRNVGMFRLHDDGSCP